MIFAGRREYNLYSLIHTLAVHTSFRLRRSRISRISRRLITPPRRLNSDGILACLGHVTVSTAGYSTI